MRAGRWPLLFLGPALIGLLVFRIAPVAIAVLGSLYAVDLRGSWRWVGFANYTDLAADPDFWWSLRVTLLFNLIINPLQVAIALGLALLVLPDDRLTRVFRTILVLPMAVSTALTAVLFGLFLDHNIGPFNTVLEAVGIGRQPFYRDASQALWTLIAIATWKGAGYWMIFMLAGLKGIPRDVLEAAALDGAGRWRRFRHVTLPLMRRPIAFVLVADTAINFLFFAPVYILTSGGPADSTRLLMFEAFQAAFTYSDQGRALAISTVLLLLLAVIVTLQLRLLRPTDG